MSELPALKSLESHATAARLAENFWNVPNA